MGIFDFLKKRAEPEIKSEKIHFDDVANWVGRKEKEICSKEKDALSSIKERTSLLVKDLKERVNVLHNIDMDSKKVEDRIKLIVKGNLETYIGYVKMLIENLDKLNEGNPKEIIELIKKNFSDFEKNSYKSYHKSTFLIGKEIADLKQSIVDYSKYLKNISDKHKDIIDSQEITSFLNLKLNLKQIDDTDKRIADVENNINILKAKIKDFEDKERKNLSEVENITKSESYLNILKKEKEIKIDEKELEKNINELKEKIDFKSLGDKFHSSEKEMNLVKSYKKNFQSAFLEDKGVNLLMLVKEAKGEDINFKINDLNDKIEKIIKEKSMIKKDETEKLLGDIEKIKLDLDNFNNEKESELRKLEKIKINKNNLISFVKEELSNFNVFVE